MGLAIGVDVGGTKIAAGVVDADGRLLAELRRETPSDSADDTAAVICELVTELCADHDAVAVGIGAAGWVNAERSVVLFAPNLAWRDEPLRDRVADGLDLPVVLENDANAAAWAEYRFGAGRGEDHLVFVGLGTGIGAGIVLSGELYRGRWGLAAEAGHMNVVPGGLRCGCGNDGCWEQYASGRAVVRLARERGLGDDIDGPAVTEAAQAGDPVAVEVLADVGAALGRGLADLAALLDPGRFVVGGGVLDAGDLIVEPARAAYAAAVTGHGHRPIADITAAALGNNAGLVGAADLARR